MAKQIVIEDKLDGIIEKLHTQNLLLDSIAGEGLEPTENLEEIAAIVKAGHAEKYFNIGDQIVVPWTATNGTVYNVPFDIVHFTSKDSTDENDQTVLEDGEVVSGMILQAHYCFPEAIQYDAPEPDNTRATDGSCDTNIATYGYNRWSESGVRAFLNGTETAGGWWKTTYELNDATKDRQSYDVAPNGYASMRGLMGGFESDFLSILKPVKVRTACNYVTDGGSSSSPTIDITHDTFFLPSKQQIYGTPQTGATIEGVAWEYWKRSLGIESTASDYPTTYDAYKCYRLDSKTSSASVWLRSCPRSGTCSSWYQSGAGYLGGGNCNGSTRVAPACVIC